MLVTICSIIYVAIIVGIVVLMKGSTLQKIVAGFMGIGALATAHVSMYTDFEWVIVLILMLEVGLVVHGTVKSDICLVILAAILLAFTSATAIFLHGTGFEVHQIQCYGEYEIALTEDGFDVKGFTEETPQIIDTLKHEASEMREWGVAVSTFKITKTYTCRIPKNRLSEYEESCMCSEYGVCEFCEGYVEEESTEVERMK